jgi:uncharacterized membrane protein
MALANRSDVSPAFSLPSILAVVAAIVSFKAGAFLGTLLAIAAIVLGLLGALLAISPRVRGGMISILSIVAGVIGIVAAVFKLVF